MVEQLIESTSIHSFFILKSLLTLFFGYVTFKLVKWLMNYARVYSVMNKIPGIDGLPLIGIAHKLEKREKMLQQWVQWANETKDLPFYRFWLGTIPFVVFTKCDHLDVKQ
jgi:hypothetical protein